MYNGIGLKTPRGSGTNGYVQRNLSFIPPKPQNTAYNYNQEHLLTSSGAAQRSRKPDEDVMMHRKKREIELECLEYREELEAAGGHDGEEVESLVGKLREKLLRRLEERVERMQDGAVKQAKDKEMERMRDAFGIKEEQPEGQAFKFETDKQRQERVAKAEEERRREAYARLRGKQV